MFFHCIKKSPVIPIIFTHPADRLKKHSFVIAVTASASPSDELQILHVLDKKGKNR